MDLWSHGALVMTTALGAFRRLSHRHFSTSSGFIPVRARSQNVELKAASRCCMDDTELLHPLL